MTTLSMCVQVGKNSVTIGKKSVEKGSVSGLGSAAAAGISNMIGRNWMKVGCYPAYNFAFIAGASSNVVSIGLQLLGFKNFMKNSIPSAAIGGVVTYAGFHAAAALGFIAAPISAPTAVVLTIVSLASRVLYKTVVAYNYDPKVIQAKTALSKAKEELTIARKQKSNADLNLSKATEKPTAGAEPSVCQQVELTKLNAEVKKANGLVAVAEQKVADANRTVRVAQHKAIRIIW